MKKGNKAKVSPKLTGLNEWIEGIEMCLLSTLRNMIMV